MSDQYRGTIRQSFAWWDVGGADLPMGLFQDFDEKFKAWERRRGFKTDEPVNPDDPEPAKQLRGNALRAKLALESKKRVLAAEAAKQAKRDAKKKPKAVKPTKFAPEIVGKVFSSDANAKRKIKDYILKNYLTIPSDYQFGVNKIDWGKYEITGSRALTPNKKSRKVAAT
ncbi:MAG: hypothetical protein ACK5VM_01625 [Bacteroidota bacterium]|jgi:hypothetical protein